MSDTDKEPHVLVIEAKGEDWHVEHLDDCPKQVYEDGMFHDVPMEFYTCRVQACIDGNGLDDLDNWEDLEPGKYKIKSYYEYHPGEYGGSYGAEHEIGLIYDNA